MKMRSYGGNFIDPSNRELSSGRPMQKRVGHMNEQLTYPQYPDSVDGYMKEQREGISSIKPRQNKKNNRFN